MLTRKAEIRKRQVLFICLVYYWIVSVSSAENSTNLTCHVDYHGDIKFTVFIPEKYQKMGVSNAYFYYKRSRRTARWTKENACSISRGNKTLKCIMRELTRNLDISTFEFKISIVSKNITYNISDIYFADKQHAKITPWTTLNKVSLCSDSTGTKYLALFAAYTNVTVEWVRYPLDVDYNNFENPRISIVGKYINDTNIVAVSTNCKKDLCTYTHQSLRPCSRYEICIKSKIGEFTTEKCKHISTYCSLESDHSILWQDTLLIVFGAIILITFISMGMALFNKYKVARDVIVDDTVTPRGHSTQEYLLRHSSEPVCHEANHVYQYPDLIKILDNNDLLWTSLTDISTPQNTTAETMLSEC